MKRYIGRFAPSPTGPLHAGSLTAAVASLLDARAHRGQWLLRIEDVDTPRVQRGAAEAIIDCLHRLGMRADGEPVFQGTRSALYAAALEQLRAAGLVYPCCCTRAELADSRLRWGDETDRRNIRDAKKTSVPAVASNCNADPATGQERVYPGTCRNGLPDGRSGRSWRVRVDHRPISWTDRNGQAHSDDLETGIGDFVGFRADGTWAYQLAVVVDDGDQAITDIVRGCDLEGSTSRQIHLQRLLGLPRPRYLHVPVVLAADGQKLSKQTGARPVDTSDPVRTLNESLVHLGMEPVPAKSLGQFWPRAIERWAQGRWIGTV